MASPPPHLGHLALILLFNFVKPTSSSLEPFPLLAAWKTACVFRKSVKIPHFSRRLCPFMVQWAAVHLSPSTMCVSPTRTCAMLTHTIPVCAVRAFTLIEVMIVLALLTTLILFISMALDIHLRQMLISRTEVEEARLARVILETIAKDIRSVVIPLREEQLEVDTAALTGVMGMPGAADLLDGIDREALENYEADEDGEEPLIYGTLPGIYGDVEWIQIDTARLPRGEMYGSRQIRRGTSFAADRLSATKTVFYYLGRDTGTLAMDDPLYQPDRLTGSIGRSYDPNALQYGLFRRQLDRYAMQYAIHEGLDWEYERDDEPLAPEVERIEFYYFDPTIEQLSTMGDWVEYWDMDERQMLPSAVMIVVGIRRNDFGRGLLSLGQTNDRESVVTYSLIVEIPVTQDILYYPEEEGAADE